LDGNAEIPVSKQMSPGPQKGIIPDSVLYFELVLNPDAHTLQEFDHYYKFTIPKYHSNQPYTDNLKKATIAGMVLSGKLLEATDKKHLEWYTKELASMPLVDVEVLLKCLDSLKGYWPDTKIKKTAEDAYSALISWIKKNSKNPEELLKKNEQRYNLLRDYADNIHLN
jgi:hypothetical protein